MRAFPDSREFSSIRMFSILNTMILGTALSQVFFVAASGSRTLKSSEEKYIFDIVKALEMEDDKTFDFRLTPAEKEREISSLRNNKPGIVEGTMGHSEGKICFDQLPYCIFFSGTMRVDDARNSGIKSAIRTPVMTDRDQACFNNFIIKNCDELGLNSKDKRIDFSKMIVKDFCAPGTVELDGSLSVGLPVTSSHVVLASFKNTYGVNLGKRSLKPCPGWDYCVLLNMDTILKWNKGCNNEDQNLPCQTPVGKSTYSLNNVKINLPTDPFEDSPLLNGTVFGKIVVYVDKGPLSCAYFSFRRFERDFYH